MSNPAFKPVIISAPFGNYIQPEGATPTLGTFTAAARPGRLWRIVKTVRYYPRIRAWVNKIGLRNPGIDWLKTQVDAGRKRVDDKLVSIHGFDATDWRRLLDDIAALKPLAVELNMSCPNVGEIHWPPTLFEQAVETGVPVVVKLPPVRFHDMAEQALAAGVRLFHCCNTLPVPAGGVSGKPLKPVALECIVWMRRRPEAAELTLIGGGGITTVDDIDDYVAAGVQHVALGTVTMNPLLLITHTPIAGLIDHAIARLG